jgi:hypothetical protein
MASDNYYDSGTRFYAGAVTAVLILAPFYIALVIWWLS